MQVHFIGDAAIRHDVGDFGNREGFTGFAFIRLPILNRAEPGRQFQVGFIGKVLVAEHQRRMFIKQRPEGREAAILGHIRQINVQHLNPEGGGQRAGFNRVNLHHQPLFVIGTGQ